MKYAALHKISTKVLFIYLSIYCMCIAVFVVAVFTTYKHAAIELVVVRFRLQIVYCFHVKVTIVGQRKCDSLP